MSFANEYEKIAASNIREMLTKCRDREHTFEYMRDTLLDHGQGDIPQDCNTLIFWHCKNMVVNLRQLKPNAIKILNCKNMRVFLRRGYVSSITISRSHDVEIDLYSEDEDAVFHMDSMYSSNVHTFTNGNALMTKCTSCVDMCVARERSWPELNYYTDMFDHPYTINIPSAKDVLQARFI